MVDWNKLLTDGLALVMNYGPKVLLAIVVLIIGRNIIGSLLKVLGRGMDKRGFDASLKPFLISLMNVAMNAMLLISVASMVGIETTSFVAILGAAGLAVGLALQGSLANFAGGVLILLFKPFKLGDLIEVGRHLGNVEEILIFNTLLLTPDNKVVIVPNASITNGDIVNYSRKGHLRVDLIVGIGYGEDMKKAKEVMLEALKATPKVCKEPVPTVAVCELGDSSVNFAVRPYANVEDYWDVYFNSLENVKRALDESKIEIPFPQRDVHLYQQNKEA